MLLCIYFFTVPKFVMRKVIHEVLRQTWLYYERISESRIPQRSDRAPPVHTTCHYVRALLVGKTLPKSVQLLYSGMHCCESSITSSFGYSSGLELIAACSDNSRPLYRVTIIILLAKLQICMYMHHHILHPSPIAFLGKVYEVTNTHHTAYLQTSSDNGSNSVTTHMVMWRLCGG